LIAHAAVWPQQLRQVSSHRSLAVSFEPQGARIGADLTQDSATLVVKTNLFTIGPYTNTAIFLLALLLVIQSLSGARLPPHSLPHPRHHWLHHPGRHRCLGEGRGVLFHILHHHGSFAPSCIFHAWYENNDASEDGQAFRVGSFVFLGNLAGIVSSNILLNKWEPQYIIPLNAT